MATLRDLLRDCPTLREPDVEWLQLLVGDWQLIADLSFADLLLWVPAPDGPWTAVAHVRPTTGQLVFVEDQVGRLADADRVAPLLTEAAHEQRIIRVRQVAAGPAGAVREEYIPVVRDGHVVAVLTRHTNLWTTRTPSRLEITYLATADALCRMVTSGEFPHFSAPTGLRRGAPRVGDGVIRLDVDGVVTYASPNAVSALHRLGHHGEVVHASLAQIVTDHLRESYPVDEGLPLVVTGRQPWRTEVAGGGTSVSMRAIPLTEAGQRFGAIVLLRDVGELRRRERELLTKEATIREIHHRVKNNLQSVAALLRLQARRVPEGEARAALQEAERRVGTIAMVHDQLSQGFEETVDFDAIAKRGIQAVVDVSTSGAPVRTVLEGSFGLLRAEDATSLAMVLSELVQNAIEHGLGSTGGTVVVRAARSADEQGRPMLAVDVEDDGKGIDPKRRPGSGLGTQIVQSLVADLQGRIAWEPVRPHGTRARFTASLRPLP
ncbi:MAG TPA: histidine kinase N-terminal domain-containing protein [Intrasporangium sp.]|uniref:sensor histidine kinase n=1 Tax=Intrasporangium sp. TaxID=1925024 RepID=UPI002D78D308|nr:histidine kinase N-terminal domain-containing protein [Intrasporangium sp.]HET7399983.1 histidine kinase N-terminal domain-containing protein [Intrasporangium sp.]